MDEDQRFDEAFDQAIVLVGQSRDDTKKDKMINRIRNDRMKFHQAIDNRKKRFFDLIRMEKDFKKLVNASDEEIEEYMHKKAEIESSFIKDNSTIRSIAQMYGIELKQGILIGEDEDKLLGLGDTDPLGVGSFGSNVVNYIGAPIVNPSEEKSKDTDKAREDDKKDDKKDRADEDKEKKDVPDQEKPTQTETAQARTTQVNPAQANSTQSAPTRQAPTTPTRQQAPTRQAPAAPARQQAPTRQAPATPARQQAPTRQAPASQTTKPAQARTTQTKSTQSASTRQAPAAPAKQQAPTRQAPASQTTTKPAQARTTQTKPTQSASTRPVPATPTRQQAPTRQAPASQTTKPAQEKTTQAKPTPKTEKAPDAKKPVVSKKIGKDALEFATVVSDFYSGKLEKTGTLTNADKVFLANNTYKSIKAKYGDRLPEMTPDQEELFEEFIKYISGTRDGYYLEDDDRSIFRNSSFPTIMANKELSDKYFKGCKSDDERFEVFKILNASANLGKKDLDEVKISHEKFLNRMKEHGIGIESKERNTSTTAENNPSATKNPEISHEDTDSKPKEGKIIPTPIVVPTNSRNNANRTTYAGGSPVPASANNGIVHSGVVLPSIRRKAKSKKSPLKIVVKGTKMLVDGKEYTYNTHIGKEFNIRSIYDDIQQSPIFGGEYFNEQVINDLIEMNKTLTNGGENVMLDPNIVYALVHHCKEDIIYDGTEEQRVESIQRANEKLKGLYFAYEQMSNRDLSRKDKDNPLRIEYDMRALKGLKESDKSAISQMANMSMFFAKIRFGFFRRLLNKLFGPRYTALPVRLENYDTGNSEGPSGSDSSKSQNQGNQRENFVKGQKAPSTPSETPKAQSQNNLNGIDVQTLDEDELNK